MSKKHLRLVTQALQLPTHLLSGAGQLVAKQIGSSLKIEQSIRVGAQFISSLEQTKFACVVRFLSGKLDTRATRHSFEEFDHGSD